MECTVRGMETVIAKDKRAAAKAESPGTDLEKECEAWDWARTAGVSEPELREALKDSLEPQK